MQNNQEDTMEKRIKEDITNIELRNVSFVCCRLKIMEITQSNIISGTLDGVVLANCTILSAIINNCYIRNCRLINCTVEASALHECDRINSKLDFCYIKCGNE